MQQSFVWLRSAGEKRGWVSDSRGSVKVERMERWNYSKKGGKGKDK